MVAGPTVADTAATAAATADTAAVSRAHPASTCGSHSSSVCTDVSANGLTSPWITVQAPVHRSAEEDTAAGMADTEVMASAAQKNRKSKSGMKANRRASLKLSPSVTSR